MTDEMNAHAMSTATAPATRSSTFIPRRRTPVATPTPAPQPEVSLISESSELSDAVEKLNLAGDRLRDIEQGIYRGRDEVWEAMKGEHTRPAPLGFSEAYEAKMERLVAEGRAVERSKLELQLAMKNVVAANPEQQELHKQELRRRDDTIRELQRELQALRRATASIGETASAGFWRRTGRAVEADVEDIRDQLDRHDHNGLRTATEKLARTLTEFAGNCHIQADLLS